VGVAVAACRGEISELAGGTAGGGGQPGTGSTTAAGDGSSTSADPGKPAPPARDPSEAGYTGSTAGATDRPAPTTRFARLTHLQWANTIKDLLGVDSGTALATSFRADPTEQGFLFDNDVLTLSVDEALQGSYQRAAAQVADEVTSDATKLVKLVPASSDAPETRARAFITDFGLRAFRRPLVSTEVDDYLALYRAAAGAYEGMTDFDGGIRLVLEGILQSPHFLYRVEPSTKKEGDVVPLDGYELASRLSYMIWNSTPDVALLVAAKDGSLSTADGVETAAKRLLADPRAADVMVRYHAQLLNTTHYSTIAPAAAFFPKAPQNLADLAVEETDRFVRAIADSGGTFGDLLTSPRAFVNKDLATIYGLTGTFTDDFQEATFDTTKRRGILTQIGFLASNSTTTTPDPIHRGVFIARRLLCAKIAAPPGNATPLPPPGDRTNRQTVEDHTQQPGSVCISCHGPIINPLGFPFENYDATGAYRTEDSGKPVDAATEPTIDGKQTQVQNALDLADDIASSSDAHACYAQHWLEFAYGRPATDVDDPIVTRLGKGSAAGDLAIRDLIVSLVKTESFLTRSTEELP
jgi:hypothetical protein